VTHVILVLSIYKFFSFSISVSGDIYMVAQLYSDFELLLFGVPECSSTPTISFPAKGSALLAALILYRGRKMTWQAAAALLWEDCYQTRAPANLRKLLVRLPGAYENSPNSPE